MLFPLYDETPQRRLPWLTIALVAINAAVFLWEVNLPQDRFKQVVAHYGFVPKRISQLNDPQQAVVVQFPGEPVLLPWGAVGRGQPERINLPADRGEIILSLFTMMFLHGSWAHLLSNMWFLWIFGDNCEDRLGRPRYLLFYFAGGLIAAFFHWMVGPGSETPVIGASGAVSTVLGGYAITFPRANVRCFLFLGIFFTLIDLPALVVLGIWFLGQFLEAFGMLKFGMNQGVAFWAHVGGFVGGWALMPWLDPRPRSSGPESSGEEDGDSMDYRSDWEI